MWDKEQGVTDYIDRLIAKNPLTEKAKKLTVYCILVCYSKLNRIDNFHDDVFCLAQNWFGAPATVIEKMVANFVTEILIKSNLKFSVTEFLLIVADKALKNEI